MRNFPLLIKPFVHFDENEVVLSLALKLVEITNRITAPVIRLYEVGILEEEVVKYLDLRKELFAEFPHILGTAKPKHHWLTHYGKAIRMYGPPLAYWTARFESKHRVAKNVAEAAKNFKNISLTLSVRQQRRMASVYYAGMFQPKEVKLPEKTREKNEIASAQQGNSDLWNKVLAFMNFGDVCCNSVVKNSTQYLRNDAVILEVLNFGDEMKVGLIETFIVKHQIVFAVVEVYLASRQQLGYYESGIKEKEACFVQLDHLADFKPLIVHGTPIKFQFVTHHNVTFNPS